MFGDNTTHQHNGKTNFRPLFVCALHGRLTTDVEGHYLCNQSTIILRDEINLNFEQLLLEWQLNNYGKVDQFSSEKTD